MAVLLALGLGFMMLALIGRSIFILYRQLAVQTDGAPRRVLMPIGIIVALAFVGLMLWFRYT